MLALTRYAGQSILFTGGITITVVSISKTGNVKLGISAPPDVTVLRKEIAYDEAGKLRTELQPSSFDFV